jgi:hypothetical protein
MALLWRSFVLQLSIMRANPDHFVALAIAPLSAVVFLSVVRHAGRPDLVPFALAAPVLMTMWRTSTMAAGEIVNEDRGLATMEPTIAAPASYPTTILGRIAAVTAIGLLGPRRLAGGPRRRRRVHHRRAPRRAWPHPDGGRLRHERHRRDHGRRVRPGSQRPHLPADRDLPVLRAGRTYL